MAKTRGYMTARLRLRLGLTLVLTAAATAALLLVTLAGCGSQSNDQNEPDGNEATSVVIVAGNTMGSMPADPTLFEDIITAAVETGGSVDVIVADGAPRSALGGLQRGIGSTAKNDRKRSMENDAIKQAVFDAVRSARPNAEEADLLAAVTLARRELLQCKGDRLVVAVCASGLSTTGLLDFTREGLLAAEPSKLVEACEEELPDLSGVEVMLCGLGDVVEPQDSLPESVAKNLREIYVEILQACGAEVTASDVATATDSAVDDELPHVTPVPVPSVDVFQPELPARIELDEQTVAFVPDTDEYADPESAKLVLARIASGMDASPSTKVRVVGSAAGYPSDRAWAQRLSEARAKVVARTLMECGVDKERITACGIGDDSGEGVTHVPDLDANGVQIPQEAAKNRKVTLIFEA